MKTYNKVQLLIKTRPLIGGGIIALAATAQFAWALPLTPIPGAMCQAYDEGALGAGKLIRTTAGIRNNSAKTINIYCPVNTDTDKKQLTITLTYKTDKPRINAGSDVFITPPLTCWAAYGRKPLYAKFKRDGAGTNSVRLNTRKITHYPVVIKCSLKPNEQLNSIFSSY